MNDTDTLNQQLALQKAREILGEHFDSCLILAACHENTSTQYCMTGTGNQFSRIGMAQNYLWRQKRGAEMTEEDDYTGQ